MPVNSAAVPQQTQSSGSPLSKVAIIVLSTVLPGVAVLALLAVLVVMIVRRSGSDHLEEADVSLAMSGNSGRVRTNTFLVMVLLKHTSAGTTVSLALHLRVLHTK